MKEKIVLITGSTDGIGKETALELAAMGAEVVLHSRTVLRGKPVLEEFEKRFPGNEFGLVTGNLENLEEVKQMAFHVVNNYEKIDVLINNAGIIANSRTLTPNGLERTFVVNYLSHFLLTNLLVEKLKQSEQGRIINVSSMVHHSAKFDFQNLQGEKFYNGYNSYACSKLENLLFTMALARKLNGTNVTVNALHPGVINTKLLHAFMGNGGGSSVKEGAQTSVYLASAPELSDVTGGYFVNKTQTEPAAIVYDTEVQDKLWEMSEKLLKYE